MGWNPPHLPAARPLPGVLGLLLLIATFFLIIALYSSPLRSGVDGGHTSYQTTSSSLDDSSNRRLLGVGTEGAGAPLKVLAFYFPQYHEVEENNRFWGKGWTEWDNLRPVDYNKFGRRLQKPSELGYYDLRDRAIRARQARLAKEYGLSGFIYHHYWFSDHAVMDAIPQLMLQDGQPDMPFAFNWVNEPWTRRWNGFSDADNEVLLQQEYSQRPEDWTAHFEWLLPFFRHRNYIKVDGAPLLVIYRLSSIKQPLATAMLKMWRELARQSGLDGLHIVQVRYQDCQVSPLVDGVIEFHPGTVDNFSRSAIESLSAAHTNYYRGTFVDWDNTPRHQHDDQASTSRMASHPAFFGMHLEAMLAKALDDPPPSAGPRFFAINAWNEWGEGNTLEPSDLYGRRYLQALRLALTSSVTRGYRGNEERPPPIHQERADKGGKVCVLIRTYHSHGDHAFFSLHKLLTSLQRLHYPHWHAIVFPTDAVDFPDLPRIIEGMNDSRVTLYDPPKALKAGYTTRDAGYKVTDHVIEHLPELCPQGRWMLVTNGDNLYSPDALDVLALKHEGAGDGRGNASPMPDLLGMGFYSRWVDWNHASKAHLLWEERCDRLRLEEARDHQEHCTRNAFRVGQTDLGSVIYNLPRFLRERRSFSGLTKKCPQCQDGAMVENLVNAGWKSKSLEQCSLHHNPNYYSCVQHGGIWRDSPLFSELDCFHPYDVALGDFLLHYGDLDHLARQETPTCVRYRALHYEIATLLVKLGKVK